MMTFQQEAPPLGAQAVEKVQRTFSAAYFLPLKKVYFGSPK
jgi:hypothetical protein